MACAKVLCLSPSTGEWQTALAVDEIDPVSCPPNSPVMTTTTKETIANNQREKMPTQLKKKTPVRARGRRQDRTRDRARTVRLAEDEADRGSGSLSAGIITKWDGERGFGFIRPTGGGAALFCHVTAFQGLSPGDQVLQGKRVLFEKETAGSRRGPARPKPDGDGFQRVKGRRTASRARAETSRVEAQAQQAVEAAATMRVGGGFGVLGDDGEDDGQADGSAEAVEHNKELLALRRENERLKRAAGEAGLSWADRVTRTAPGAAEDEDEHSDVAPWRGTTVASGTRRSWASDSDSDDE